MRFNRILPRKTSKSELYCILLEGNHLDTVSRSYLEVGVNNLVPSLAQTASPANVIKISKRVQVSINTFKLLKIST